MPYITTFYINDISLATATAVFEDAALTICAPDGFYSDSVTAREQVGCVLLPEQVCPACCTDNCAGWEITFVTDGSITYVECGSGLTKSMKEKIGVVQTLCAVRGEIPIVTDGTVNVVNTQYCGCCFGQPCNNWKWVPPIDVTPGVSISITNCSGVVETIDFVGGLESFFCILSGTTPTIISGNGYLEFVNCLCL